MRISKTWLRPILTAVLFPIVLTGSMWALDEFSGEEWLPWTNVAVSSQQAVAIAEKGCFARYPGTDALAPWHTKLVAGRWSVVGQDIGRYWTLQRHSYAWAGAVIDANTGDVIACHMGVE